MSVKERHQWLEYMLRRPESRLPIRPRGSTTLITSENKKLYQDAARAHARRNRDDPFAYARAMKAMANGLYYPDEIKEGNISL